MKEEQRLKTIRDVLFALAAASVCAIVLGYLYDCYYDLNDDVLIKDILSGTYTGTPEGRTIQMLYPLGWVISLFYRLLPALPWFGIFLCACHFLCFFLIGKRVVSLAAGLVKKSVLLALEALLFAGLLLWELVYVQYSVTSALLAATGIFLFYTTDDALQTARFVRKNTVSMLLVTASFYVRTEVMLLLCPLIAAAGIAKWFGGAKRTKTRPFCGSNLIKYLTVPVIVVIGMGIGFAADKAAYGGSEWKEFDDFFAYRTELYDFQEAPPDYEENRAYYEKIGLEEAEVQLLLNYNFSLDERIDAALLSDMILYNRAYLGKDYFKYSLYEGVRSYLYRCLHAQDGKWIYVVAALYLLVFLSGMMHWDSSVPWKLLLLAAMRSVSWLYLIMRGRIRDRVTTPLYLCETLILCAMLLWQLRSLSVAEREPFQKPDGEEHAAARRERAPFLPRYRRYWPLTAALILTGLTIVPAWNGLSEVEAEQRRRESVNEEWEILRGCLAEGKENFYFLDVYSTVAYSEPMFLRVDNGYRNYDICGGWAAKSPIYAEKLSRYGIGDIESDLYYMNNVFFVSSIGRDAHWLVEYYRCRGYDVRLHEEFRVSAAGQERFVVYKVCEAYETSHVWPGFGQSLHRKSMTD